MALPPTEKQEKREKKKTCQHQLSTSLKPPTSPVSLLQGSGQRKVPRAGADLDCLGPLGDDPVLADDVPSHDVPPVEDDDHRLALALLQGHLVESPQHTDGVVVEAGLEVQLDHLLAGAGAGVRHDHRDLVHGLVEGRVAAGRAASGRNGLRVRVVGALGHVVGTVGDHVGGRVDVGVYEERKAVGLEVGGREIVRGVELGRRLGHTGGCAGCGSVRGCIADLLDAKAGVIEGGVAQAEAELEARLDAGLVEMAVVNEEALVKVFLREPGSGLVHEVHAVVRGLLADGERQLPGGVYVAVENVHERIAGFLAGKSSEHDSGDVGVLDELLVEDDTDGMDDDDGVIAVGRDGLDQSLSVIPEGKVLPVADVTIHLKVSLAGIRSDEDQAREGNLGGGIDLGVGIVVDNGLDDTAVLDGTALDGLEGSDEVGEVGGSGSPAHSESSVVAAAVSTAVGAVLGLAGVGSEDADLLGPAQGQRAVDVLEQDIGLGGNFAGVLAVVGTHIDPLVDESEVCFLDGGLVTVLVGGPRVEVRLGVCFRALANEEVGSHDARGHVVEPPFGDSPVKHGTSEVAAPVGRPGVEFRISRHAHVEARESLQRKGSAKMFTPGASSPEQLTLSTPAI